MTQFSSIYEYLKFIKSQSIACRMNTLYCYVLLLSSFGLVSLTQLEVKVLIPLLEETKCSAAKNSTVINTEDQSYVQFNFTDLISGGKGGRNANLHDFEIKGFIMPVNGKHHYIFMCHYVADPLVECRDCPHTIPSLGTCIIPANRDLMCDGTSHCLVDECGCDDVFQCRDKSGCIAFPNLCDGILDCRDGSDESLCEDSRVFVCGVTSSRRVVSSFLWCGGHDVISRFCHPEIQIESCDDEAFVYQTKSTQLLNAQKCLDMLKQVSISGSFDKICRALCAGETICNLPFTDFREDVIQCNVNNEYVLFSQICDGHINCSNGFDERNCEGRFYCSGGNDPMPEWVSIKLKCNGFRNCGNGLDECGEDCPDSFRNFIQNTQLKPAAIILGLAMVYLNVKLIKRCWRRGNPRERLFDDSASWFLKIQLGLYNLLGVVVLGVALLSKKDYCEKHDLSWRAGTPCTILGLVFMVSYHGSAMIIAVLGAYRCLTLYTSRDLVSVVKWVSIFAGVINIIAATVPILPIPGIRDIFRSELLFVNEIPFIFSRDKWKNIGHVTSIYGGYFVNRSSDITVEHMLQDLRSITTSPEIFDYTEIGFYGFLPLCIPDIFGLQDHQWRFRFAYQGFIVLWTIFLVATLVLFTKKLVRTAKDSTFALSRRKTLVPGDSVKLPGAFSETNVDCDDCIASNTDAVQSLQTPEVTQPSKREFPAQLSCLDKCSAKRHSVLSTIFEADVSRCSTPTGALPNVGLDLPPASDNINPPPPRSNLAEINDYSLIFLLFFEMIMWISIVSLSQVHILAGTRSSVFQLEFFTLVILPLRSVFSSVICLCRVDRIVESVNKRREERRKRSRLKKGLDEISAQTVDEMIAGMECESSVDGQRRAENAAVIKAEAIQEILNLI